MSKANDLLTSILQWCSTPGAGHPMWDDVTKLREYIASVPAAPLGVDMRDAELKLATWLDEGYVSAHDAATIAAKAVELFSRTRGEGGCPECGSQDDTMLAWLDGAKERAMSNHQYSEAALLRDVACRLRSLMKPAAPAEVLAGPNELGPGVWVAFRNGYEFWESRAVPHSALVSLNNLTWVRVADFPNPPVEPPKPVMPSGPAPRRFIARAGLCARYGVCKHENALQIDGEREFIGCNLQDSISKAIAAGWQIEWLDPEPKEKT